MRDTSMTDDLTIRREHNVGAQESPVLELHDCSVALSGEEPGLNVLTWLPGRKTEPNRTVPPFIGMRPLFPGDDAPEGTPGTGDALCRPCRGTGVSDAGGCYNCGGTGIVIQAIGG